MDMDKLNEQFLYYQTMREDLPEDIKTLCGFDNSEEDKICQMDVLWGYLRGVKAAETNQLMLDLLFKVAEVVLSIPHSNAGEKRIFFVY